MLDEQLDALTAAGCRRIFAGKKIGRNDARPALNARLAFVVPGDRRGQSITGPRHEPQGTRDRKAWWGSSETSTGKHLPIRGHPAPTAPRPPLTHALSLPTDAPLSSDRSAVLPGDSSDAVAAQTGRPRRRPGPSRVHIHKKRTHRSWGANVIDPHMRSRTWQSACVVAAVGGDIRAWGGGRTGRPALGFGSDGVRVRRTAGFGVGDLSGFWGRSWGGCGRRRPR